MRTPPGHVTWSIRTLVVTIALMFTLALMAGFGVQSGSASPVDADPVPLDTALFRSYYGEMRPDDPVLTLGDGTQVKSSNYRGVEVGGRRLYYRAWPHTSFDPWTRGAVSFQQVRVLAEVDLESDFPLVIYEVASH